MRNTGDADDRLVAIRSDAADRVEIHEVRHENGMARMRPLKDGLPLPAGETVVLKPGDYHLMFITPRDGFVARGTVDATLVFETAGSLDVAFDARPLDASGTVADGGHAHH
ncbi:copper chaperone PCu(A)C [Lysobacter hankyongensis]|uniref:copper chaperone PCu(A)C n=1 Tax=Lysobacter hankyongensis TaxID=1176535 RepID=UPI0031E7E8BE